MTDKIPVSAMRTFLVLLNPFAPHLTSELWQRLNSPGDITAQAWPDHDETFLVEDEIEIVLQVNGKVRDRITVPLEATNEQLEAAARANEKVRNCGWRPDDSQSRGRSQKTCQRRRGLSRLCGMFKEFKEFAIKGNAIDLAVGVIIGAAFGGIVTSLVKDILMPPIGLLTGGLDFSNKFLVLKEAPGGGGLRHPGRRREGRRDHVELRQLHYRGH